MLMGYDKVEDDILGFVILQYTVSRPLEEDVLWFTF